MTYLCKNPYYLETQNMYVDCGNCRACRLRRRGEWSLRMEHESSTREHKTSFVTLTYDSDNIPPHESLKRRDLQLFFKRLRRQIDYHHGKHIKFKYYACGEYGPKTHRPHYHLILFGLDAKYKDLVYECWKKCKPECYKYVMTSDTKTFKYVAGYASKKLGINYNKHFKKLYPKKEPEFQLQSLGIGKTYIMNIADIVKEKKTIRFNGKDRIPPRYYRKLLNLTAVDYKEHINEYQTKVYEKVIDIYGKTGLVLSEKINTVASRYSYAQRLVTKKFFECLNIIRQESDVRLAQMEKDWRCKIEPIIA